jgi:ABC-type multidrug transport system fused ATPase/permease subunit
MYLILLVFALKDNQYRILIFILIVLSFILIFLTGSRGAYLATIFALFLFMKNREVNYRFIYLSVLVSAIAVVVIINYDMIEFMIKRLDNPAKRDLLLEYALNSISSATPYQFLFGRDHDYFVNTYHLVTHNDFFRIVIHWGVIFAVIYYATLFFTLGHIFLSNLFSKRNQFYNLFIMMIILAFLLRSTFSNLFPVVAVFYFVGSYYGMRKRRYRVNNLYAPK